MKLVRLSACIPVLVFIGLTIYFISQHHVLPLSRDQWHMYTPYFETGWWQAALTPMSEHRHIIPFFFFHIDMSVFHGLNHFLVSLGALFDLLIITLLLFALRSTQSIQNTDKLFLALFILFALSWLMNIAQLGWGFMSSMYYFAIFNYLLAITCAWKAVIHKQPSLWAASLLLGFICTFSFGIGVLVWPALFLLCYLWRAPVAAYLLVVAGLAGCISLFFALPGGGSIQKTLQLDIFSTLKFVFTLASGPVYYLGKSLRLMDIDSLKLFATIIGSTVTTISLVFVAWMFISRKTLDLFLSLSLALLMLGLGTAALISFTRGEFFLDIWVDRYQIWATLFWLGFLLLVFNLLQHKGLPRKALLALFISLPVLAMPSQLDMGARLSEYKIRVSKALLVFRSGIVNEDDAKDAMHWNWKGKLQNFFYVWPHIQQHRKNIFYDFPHTPILHPITFDLQAVKPIDLSVVTQENIAPDSLFEPSLHINENNQQFLTQWNIAEINNIPGYRINAQTPEDLDWKYAWVVNSAGLICGFGIPIKHNPFPRSNWKHIGKNHNAFFSINNFSGQENYKIVFFNKESDAPAYRAALTVAR